MKRQGFWGVALVDAIVSIASKKYRAVLSDAMETIASTYRRTCGFALMLFAFAPLAALAGTLGEGLNCPSLEWTTGGIQSRSDENVNWTYNTDDSYSDGACVVSGAGGAGVATSWLAATVEGPCTISFRYKVQTYNGTFKVMDGEETLYEFTGVTGTSPSWQQKEFDLADGTHEIKLQYRHPGMGYAYEFNGVKVDEFTVTPTATLASALDVTNLTFTTGGDANWFPQTETTHDGEDAVQSGAISANQSTWMETTVTGPKQIRFWWKTSSEANYDILRFYVDGTEKASVSGTTDWQQQTVRISGTGTHTLKWQYSKDGSVDSGSDCAWLDQVELCEAILVDNKFENGNFASYGYADYYPSGSFGWSCVGGSIEIHRYQTYTELQAPCPSYMDSSVAVCELQSDAYTTIYQAITIPAGTTYEVSCVHGGREDVDEDQIMSIGCIWADSGIALTHDNFKLNALPLTKLSEAGSVDGSFAKIHSNEWQHVGTTISNNSATDRVAYIGFSAVSGGEPGWGNLVAYAYVGVPIHQMLVKTYYVNGTTGNDSNPGFVATSAKKTIQAAIDAATDGSTIIVSDGTYGAISVQGFRGIIIKSANGALSTFIDGSNATTVANLNSDNSTANSGAAVNQIIGFTLQNGTSGAGGNGALKCGLARNCIFRNNYGAGYGGGSVAAGGCVIINCIAYENRYGSSWGGGVFANCLVVNCTLYNNVGYGLWDGGIYNTISYGNSQGDYRSYGCANTFHNCLAARIWDSDLGNITGDPMFENAESADLSLREDSPCIDAGDSKWYAELKFYDNYAIPQEYFTTDFFGNPRVVGCQVDMGAIEYGAQSPWAEGLVAWYKFDGDIYDSSGNGNDLTNGGEATLVADRDGNANSACHFTGSNASRLWWTSGLDMSNTFSYAVWFRTSVPMSSHGTSSTAWNPGNDILNAGNHGWENVGIGLRVGTDGVAVVEHGNFYRPTVFTYSASLGEDWHHVVMTVETNGAPVVYLDGEYVGTGSNDGRMKFIGLEGIGGGSWGNYTGDADDLRIYNRVLSAAEVRAIYRGTEDDGLVAWYKFDGDTTDAEGNWNTLTVESSISYIADRNGEGGKAVRLDGTGCLYGNMEHDVTNQFTFACWFKAEIETRLVTESTSGISGTSDYSKFLDGGSSYPIAVGTNGINVFEHGNFHLPALFMYDAEIGTGWNHLAMSVNEDGIIVYLNGTEIGRRSRAGTDWAVSIGEGGWDNGSAQRYVGIGSMGYGGHFQGGVDDVRVYSRVLSAAEVRVIYNEGGSDPTVYRTVTFNANGGTAATGSRRVADGAAVGTLPTATWDGHEFLGWFTDAEGGEEVAAETVVTADVTWYAHWRAIPLDEAFGGEFEMTTGGDAVWFAARRDEGVASTAYVATSGDIGDSQSSWMQTTVTGACTVAFRWMVSSETNYDWLRVYVDDVEQGAISGSQDWTEKTITVDKTGPAVVKWVYSKDGSVSSGEDCGRVDDLVVTQIVPEPTVWTVTFDANGGTCGDEARAVTNGCEAGTLPVPDERENYDFVGWYTAALGGSVVADETIVTTDVTWFAHWQFNAVVPTYGPWGESKDVKNPDKLGPTYLQNMPVTIYGEAGSEGDVVAVYRTDTDAVCGLGKVLDDSGKVTVVCYAPAGTELHFKVWLAASGIEYPTILDCDTPCDLSAPTPGIFYAGHSLRVSDDEYLMLDLEEADWHAISFNVLPEDVSPESVFADVAEHIQAVTQGVDFWMPGQIGSLKSIEIGKAYWVKTKEDDVAWTIYGTTAPETQIELEEGWNFVGYAGVKEGAIATVMRTAFADDAISYVTCGIEFYPGGTLTKMTPGKAYWVYAKRDYTLVYDEVPQVKLAMAAASGGRGATALPKLATAGVTTPTFGPWGESSAVKNPDQLGPTYLMNMPVSIYGTAAVAGDCIAVYRQDTHTLCGLGKVLDSSGQVTLVCYAPKGTTLHFEVWQASSGLDSPQILDCASDLTAPAIGSFFTGHSLHVAWNKENPLPEISSPTPATIKEVLSEAKDSILATKITNETEYVAFREWSGKVQPQGGGDAVGAAGVMAAPNAWVSYALGSETLLEAAPTDEDLTVEAFEPKSGEDGKFDFTVSVKDVEVGGAATTEAQMEQVKENLKQVFGLEGGTTLEEGGMSSANVEIEFGAPQDGKVRFTAGPKDTDAKTFFMKVMVK